jgi:hypothetical protein
MKILKKIALVLCLFAVLNTGLSMFLPSQHAAAQATPATTAPPVCDPKTEECNSCGSLSTCLNDTSGGPDSSACVAGSHTSLEWILCPIVTGVGKFADAINNALESQLNFSTNNYLADSASTNNKCGADKCQVNKAWVIVKNIVSGLVVVLMLVMVISQAAGGQLFDAYTVKKMLPRLAIAVILIQFSWVLSKYTISVVNDIAYGVKQIMAAPFGGAGQMDLPSILHHLNKAFPIATQFAVVGLVLLLIAFDYMLPILIFAILAIASAVLIGLATIVFRNAFVVMAVIFAPLALLLWAMPGQMMQGYWRKYTDNVLKMLFLFPLMMAIIYGGRIVAWVAGDLGFPGPMDYFVVMVAFFAPYFILPKAFKWGGSWLATVNREIATNRATTGLYGFLRKKPLDQISHEAKAIANKYDPNGSTFGRFNTDKMGRFRKAVLTNRKGEARRKLWSGNLPNAWMSGHLRSELGMQHVYSDAKQFREGQDEADQKELDRGVDMMKNGRHSHTLMGGTQDWSSGEAKVEFLAPHEKGRRGWQFLQLAQQVGSHSKRGRRAANAAELLNNPQNLGIAQELTFIESEKDSFKKVAKAAYDKKKSGAPLSRQEELLAKKYTGSKGEFSWQDKTDEQKSHELDLAKKYAGTDVLIDEVKDANGDVVPGLKALKTRRMEDYQKRHQSKANTSVANSYIAGTLVGQRDITDAEVIAMEQEAAQQGRTVTTNTDGSVTMDLPVAHTDVVQPITRKPDAMWTDKDDAMWFLTEIINSQNFAQLGESDMKGVATAINENPEQAGIVFAGKKGQTAALPQTLVAELALKMARSSRTGDDPYARAGLVRLATAPSQRPAFDQVLATLPTTAPKMHHQMVREIYDDQLVDVGGGVMKAANDPSLTEAEAANVAIDADTFVAYSGKEAHSAAGQAQLRAAEAALPLVIDGRRPGQQRAGSPGYAPAGGGAAAPAGGYMPTASGEEDTGGAIPYTAAEPAGAAPIKARMSQLQTRMKNPSTPRAEYDKLYSETRQLRQQLDQLRQQSGGGAAAPITVSNSPGQARKVGFSADELGSMTPQQFEQARTEYLDSEEGQRLGQTVYARDVTRQQGGGTSASTPVTISVDSTSGAPAPSLKPHLDPAEVEQAVANLQGLVKKGLVSAEEAQKIQLELTPPGWTPAAGVAASTTTASATPAPAAAPAPARTSAVEPAPAGTPPGASISERAASVAGATVAPTAAAGPPPAALYSPAPAKVTQVIQQNITQNVQPSRSTQTLAVRNNAGEVSTGNLHSQYSSERPGSADTRWQQQQHQESEMRRAFADALKPVAEAMKKGGSATSVNTSRPAEQAARRIAEGQSNKVSTR